MLTVTWASDLGAVAATNIPAIATANTMDLIPRIDSPHDCRDRYRPVPAVLTVAIGVIRV
jgi:hypothetical protein